MDFYLLSLSVKNDFTFFKLLSIGIVRGRQPVQQARSTVHERTGQRADRNAQPAGQQSPPGSADYR